MFLLSSSAPASTSAGDIAHTPIIHNSLPRPAPDALEETVLLGEPVQRVVGLAHGAHEAAEGVWLVLASVATVLVDLADADLDGGVILGLDDATGSVALAGDVDCDPR
jgi:ABC-type Fe3+-hydroxamate transport system substrate-binding protein